MSSVRQERTRPAPSSVSAEDFESVLASAITTLDPQTDEAALKASTNLKRATIILGQHEDQKLHRQNGRTSAAFRVLVMIWRFGPVEARDIARLSGVSRQAVSAVLATLEKDDLIVRDRATKTDKRLAPVTITSAGQEFVESNLPLQNKLHRGFFSALSSDELETLTGLLSRLIVAAHDGP